MRSKKVCNHEWRQIVYTGITPRPQGSSDYSPPHYYHEFYCVKCLEVGRIMKTDRRKLTD